MNEREKCFAYYVEVYHKEDSTRYVLQSKNFNTIEEALNFAKLIDYLEDNYEANLMGLVGDEEEYDIIQIGWFKEQLYGLDLIYF